jgi:hypothetical protein
MPAKKCRILISPQAQPKEIAVPGKLPFHILPVVGTIWIIHYNPELKLRAIDLIFQNKNKITWRERWAILIGVKDRPILF